MPDNNFNNKNFDSVLSSLGNRVDKQKLTNAAKNGNTDELINSLSPEDKKKLNSVLSDEKALEAVLKSPQAAAILKLLSGGKK